MKYYTNVRIYPLNFKASLLLSTDNSQVKLSGICEVKNPRLISKMAWH